MAAGDKNIKDIRMNFPAPRPVFTARRRTLLATALGAGLLAGSEEHTAELPSQR